LFAAWAVHAQQTAAFDVASVKPASGQSVPPSFPLGPGEAFRNTGGYLRADFDVWSYIEFAYRIWPSAEQTRALARLPKWVTQDRYSVEARAAGNPGKDQMRLMMQSLLAERFRLAVHFETHDVPLYAIGFVQSGKLGPKLIPHADGPPCADRLDPALHPISASGSPAFPPVCDSLAVLRKSGGAVMMAGVRNTTMELLARHLSVLDLGRPLIDRTGLTGRFDFTIEWTPDATIPDAPAPTSVQALRDQLGLKLEPATGPIQILIVDRIERPSAN
jgi:uncharacterized protein (TIGR03435 family)